jgi:hypothetical protein
MIGIKKNPKRYKINDALDNANIFSRYCRDEIETAEEGKKNNMYDYIINKCHVSVETKRNGRVHLIEEF